MWVSLDKFIHLFIFIFLIENFDSNILAEIFCVVKKEPFFFYICYSKNYASEIFIQIFVSNIPVTFTIT